MIGSPPEALTRLPPLCFAEGDDAFAGAAPPRGGSCSASLAKEAMQAAMVIYRNNSGLRILMLRKPLLF